MASGSSPICRSRSSGGHLDAPVSAWKPVMLFYHSSMESLAISIAQLVQKRLHDGLRSVELSDAIQWRRFRDGWPNIFINNVGEVAGRDVIFVASFHSPEVIFEQLSLIYSFPRYFVRSFRLILPFFPTATMERVDYEGQIVTAKFHVPTCVNQSLATMLSAIPLAARGPTQIIIFDIHNLQERFYFTDQIIPRLLTAIPYLLKELKIYENISVAFPDEGAHKRFHSFFDEMYPQITCIKTRNGDNREITIKEGKPTGRHVVIVDDLVQTGGTLIESAKALVSQGAIQISFFVTHAVFPQESWKKFITNDLPLGNFWITDSIPHSVRIATNKPFKLISLGDAIVDSLLSVDLLKQQ